MNKKFVIFLISIICSIHNSCGQINGNSINNEFYQTSLNNNAQDQNMQGQNISSFNTQTVQNTDYAFNPNGQQGQSTEISNEQYFNNQLYNKNELPKRIRDLVDGFNNFTIRYDENKMKKDEKRKGDSIVGNMHCIKALMANIYYPIQFVNSDHYFKTVCNENTDIEPLIYLRELLPSNKQVCDDNGKNYKIAYDMLRAKHFHNCIKDNQNNYCYNSIYKTYIDDAISNYKTNEKKKDSYSNSIKNSCESEDNKVNFCYKMMLFGNAVAKKIAKETITLEIYYDSNNTYSMQVNPPQNYGDLERNCKIDDIVQSIIADKDNIMDTNAKQLIDIYLQSSGASGIFNIRKILVKISVTVMVTICLLI